MLLDSASTATASAQNSRRGSCAFQYKGLDYIDYGNDILVISNCYSLSVLVSSLVEKTF